MNLTLLSCVYKNLFCTFFNIIDPFSIDKQGNDIGRQYRSGIYYFPEDESEFLPLIKHVIACKENEYKRKLATEIAPIKNLVRAEEYHQVISLNIQMPIAMLI